MGETVFSFICFLVLSPIVQNIYLFAHIHLPGCGRHYESVNSSHTICTYLNPVIKKGGEDSSRYYFNTIPIIFQIMVMCNVKALCWPAQIFYPLT